MKEKNRNAEILKLLQTKEYMRVEELANVLSVSPSSVRRTLTELEDKGLIKRTHGGANIIDANNLTPSFTYRTHQNVFEKKIIALKAIKLIKEGDVIFIDASTSAYFMVEYLSEFDNIRVITNGIDTLSLLSKYGIPAISTGGSVSKTTKSALVGPYAENLIETIHANIAFFSAQSMTKDGVIYDSYDDETNIVRRMMQNSSRKVFLCDSTKLGKISPYKLCGVDEVDDIICNEDISSFFNIKHNVNIIY